VAPSPQQIAAIKRALKTADEAGIARSHARGMVKGLDMSPAGKRARMIEQGYEPGWMHGTPAGSIDGFRPSSEGPLGAGVYVTKDPQRAVDNVSAMASGGYDAIKRTLKQMKEDAERRKGTDIKTYRR
jgi:hypothetical protein